ncbi:hypothetical protein J7E51_12780 [Priestia megaterium]|nr:hypothetical protein [Priestia megaterium]
MLLVQYLNNNDISLIVLKLTGDKVNKDTTSDKIVITVLSSNEELVVNMIKGKLVAIEEVK